MERGVRSFTNLTKTPFNQWEERDSSLTHSTVALDPNASHAAVQQLVLRAEKFLHWQFTPLSFWANLCLQGVKRQRRLLGEISFLQVFLFPIVLSHVIINILMYLVYLSFFKDYIFLLHINTESSVTNTDPH